MLKVALIDDDEKSRASLKALIENYGQENDETFSIATFESGDYFLNAFHLDFDIIFLDIEMPGLDGLATAKYIRRKDQNVTIVFVTNFAKYAINGYEVGALDFLLKPISPFDFNFKFKRIVRHAEMAVRSVVFVPKGKEARRLPVASIYYIEVRNHDLIYHTSEGSFLTRGTLRHAEETLAKEGFSLCNSCYLVNLRHVSGILPDAIHVEGETIQTSHSKRVAFLKKLADFLGGE